MNAPLAPRARTVDIEDVERFDALVAAGAKSMHGWHFQSVDLRGRSQELVVLKASGAIFMGCSFAEGIEDLLRSRGALIFPTLPHIPFNAYRGHLYTGAELYTGIGELEYEAVPDALIYQWTLQAGAGRALNATLAMAMHDHAISDALDDFLTASEGTRVVGVMGGHAGARGSADFAQAAQLGRALTRQGFMVATGGGPGAMEAANLGAYLAPYDDAALDSAQRTLGAVPGFRPSITAWARAAQEVLRQFPAGSASLGIPTWFYGHEPPNLFATHTAKYFANSIREAVLLARSNGGIIFLPGAAGTVQEIFQDACENYYAADAAVTPMILVGRQHWESELPVRPLLEALAGGRTMSGHVHVVDSIEEACALLGDLPRATAAV
ncbi:LOG family protein [Arthrobacter sp. GMC3]|uniref:LOG family protein n=1 Tax=Arthrobacter sp. GMC3 TaxID=2058894 RepID=UPI000CE3CF4E|nr:LOG family protein [Arthrobacter sp. GMC3]